MMTMLLKVTFDGLELWYLVNSVYFSAFRLREMKFQVQGSSPVTGDLVTLGRFLSSIISVGWLSVREVLCFCFCGFLMLSHASIWKS